MAAPNLFLIYVTDVDASATFYSSLFEIEPSFTSPRYVAFEVAPGVLFALWAGRREHAVPGTPRTSEVGLMMPGRRPRWTRSTHGGRRGESAWWRSPTTRCSAAPS